MCCEKESWSQVLQYYLGSDVKNQRFLLLPLVSPSSILTCPLMGPGRFAADQWLANSFIDMTNETSALTRMPGQLVGMAMPCSRDAYSRGHEFILLSSIFKDSFGVFFLFFFFLDKLKDYSMSIFLGGDYVTWISQDSNTFDFECFLKGCEWFSELFLYCVPSWLSCKISPVSRI